MALIKSEYKVAKIQQGNPYLGEVHLTIELTTNESLEIVENYQGNGFVSQGYEEVIAEKGEHTWKKGVLSGITYAYNKLIGNQGLKVTITRVSGLITDTNPTILGFAASRAILTKLEHTECKQDLAILENLVLNSWNDDFEAIPDFENECKNSWNENMEDI